MPWVAVRARAATEHEPRIRAHDGTLTLTPGAAGGLRVKCNYLRRHLSHKT